jgi:hypothetical protein
MITRADLQEYILEYLRTHGGKTRIVPLCRWIWDQHEAELRGSGDLFYTWQYDVRWAAKRLRDRGKMKPVDDSPKGVWELAA